MEVKAIFNNFKINSKSYLISIFSIFIFIILWQLIGQLKIIDPLFIGSPVQIAKEIIDFFISGEIYPHLLASFQAFVIGLILAILIGVTGGLAVGLKDNLYNFISPYLFALHSTPKIALMPLIIIWFGIGFKAKITLIFLMSVIPIIVSTVDSAKTIDSSLIKMAHSFKASNSFVIKTIIFYGSLPYIISGIRIAVGRAFIGLVVAEFFGLGIGLGYLISFYGATFQTNRLMAIIVLIVIFNFLIVNVIIYFIEKKVIKWDY